VVDAGLDGERGQEVADSQHLAPGGDRRSVGSAPAPCTAAAAVSAHCRVIARFEG
jgi:hypothetical protein